MSNTTRRIRFGRTAAVLAVVGGKGGLLTGWNGEFFRRALTFFLYIELGRNGQGYLSAQDLFQIVYLS